MRVVLALSLLVCTPAYAERHVMERGETLQHVANAYGCSVGEVMRANDVKTTLLPAGTVVDVPKCSIRLRAQTRTRQDKPRAKPISDDAKARAALAVIDGATWVEPVKPTPTKGPLRDSKALSGGDGYRVRRPQLAFGAPYVVDHLRGVIGEVRALYPDVHTLAIGDISAEHGGKLAAHKSHQTGLDVDVGFYFTQQPEGYPERFAAADSTLDLQATWALITAFARTSDLDDGVSMMFLDYEVQRRLYTWAAKRGTPEADLEQLFQYPHGKDAASGLIRHWPNHADHVHVRFKSRR